MIKKEYLLFITQNNKQLILNHLNKALLCDTNKVGAFEMLSKIESKNK